MSPLLQKKKKMELLVMIDQSYILRTLSLYSFAFRTLMKYVALIKD